MSNEFAELDALASQAYEATPRRIGGSDVAAILGFSPWATPWDVWNDMRFGRSSENTAVTERGNRLEPVLLDWYHDHHHPILERQLEITGLEPWQGGHLDARAEGSRIVEAKTDAVNFWAPDGTVVERWPEGEETPIPAYYAAQGYWYLELTQAVACDFVVLTGRLDFRVVTLLPDHRIQGAIRSQVAAWYQRHVQEGIQPTVDWSAAARAHASRVLPEGKKLAIATPAEAALVQTYAKIAQELKGLERRKMALGTEILIQLGTRYGLTLEDGGRVIGPSVRGRSTVDWEAAYKAHPELKEMLAPFTSQGKPTRQVRIYGLGDNDNE